MFLWQINRNLCCQININTEGDTDDGKTRIEKCKAVGGGSNYGAWQKLRKGKIATEVYKQIERIELVTIKDVQRLIDETMGRVKNPGPLAEEIADVEIMLEQMKIMFDNVLLVIGWRAEKLDRLEKRLEGKKE